LGQQPERAVPFYTQAAEQLFDRHDLQGVMRCTDAALSCDMSGEFPARLRALQSMVAYWGERGELALELGVPALAGLKAGSSLWCKLLGSLIVGGHFRNQEQVARMIELLLSTSPEPKAIAAYVEALGQIGGARIYSGARQQVEGLLERIMEVGADAMLHDALVRGWMRFLKGFFLHFFEARPWQAFMTADVGLRDFRDMGVERDENVTRVVSGMALASLGDLSGAVERLREAKVAALRAEHRISVHFAHHYLFQALASSPEPAHRQEAHDLALEWLVDPACYSFQRAVASAALAQVMLASGALSEAEVYARTACELLAPFKCYSVFGNRALSAVLLAQGRAAEAREVAELGVRELEQMGSQGVFAVVVRLALAEACFAQGDASAGEAALRETLQCVRARANDIPDAAARERFLRQVPENARTLELARQLWGELQEPGDSV
ncbi:MAG TPA: serine/threonine-protein kinase PknK, partial [Archangium sp.]